MIKPINTKSIINNIRLVFKAKDINKLSKSAYDFLYLTSGFIAHYDINGFKSYYFDLRNLIKDLKDSSDVVNPEYYLSDSFKENNEYYTSKAKTLKQVKPLIEEFEDSINIYFADKEREEDIGTINRLMAKHNLNLGEVK